MDLRGLAGLSSPILSLCSDAENLGQDGLELFGVSRICEKRGENTRALKEEVHIPVVKTNTDGLTFNDRLALFHGLSVPQELLYTRTP
jgi:hypothetical protein